MLERWWKVENNSGKSLRINCVCTCMLQRKRKQIEIKCAYVHTQNNTRNHGEIHTYKYTHIRAYIQNMIASKSPYTEIVKFDMKPTV